MAWSRYSLGAVPAVRAAVATRCCCTRLLMSSLAQFAVDPEKHKLLPNRIWPSVSLLHDVVKEAHTQVEQEGRAGSCLFIAPRSSAKQRFRECSLYAWFGMFFR